MPRGNPRLAEARANRKPVEDRWRLALNEKCFIEKDKYQFTLYEIIKAEASTYNMSRGHYNNISSAVDRALELNLIDVVIHQDVTQKVSKYHCHYEDGLLILNVAG